MERRAPAWSNRSERAALRNADRESEGRGSEAVGGEKSGGRRQEAVGRRHYAESRRQTTNNQSTMPGSTPLLRDFLSPHVTCFLPSAFCVLPSRSEPARRPHAQLSALRRATGNGFCFYRLAGGSENGRHRSKAERAGAARHGFQGGASSRRAAWRVFQRETCRVVAGLLLMPDAVHSGLAWDAVLV